MRVTPYLARSNIIDAILACRSVACHYTLRILISHFFCQVISTKKLSTSTEQGGGLLARVTRATAKVCAKGDPPYTVAWVTPPLPAPCVLRHTTVGVDRFLKTIISGRSDLRLMRECSPSCWTINIAHIVQVLVGSSERTPPLVSKQCFGVAY